MSDRVELRSEVARTKTLWADCAACPGWRLHQVVIFAHGKGQKVTRRRVCTACETGTDLTAAEQPWHVCHRPGCSHIFTRVVMVRHRFLIRKVPVNEHTHQLVKVPCTVRRHECDHCGFRFSTFATAAYAAC